MADVYPRPYLSSTMDGVDELQATWLCNLLHERNPQSDIEVTPEDDGARIVIKDPTPSPGVSGCGGATSVDMHVADADCPILRLLLR